MKLVNGGLDESTVFVGNMFHCSPSRAVINIVVHDGRCLEGEIMCNIMVILHIVRPI